MATHIPNPSQTAPAADDTSAGFLPESEHILLAQATGGGAQQGQGGGNTPAQAAAAALLKAIGEGASLQQALAAVRQAALQAGANLAQVQALVTAARGLFANPPADDPLGSIISSLNSSLQGVQARDRGEDGGNRFDSASNPFSRSQDADAGQDDGDRPSALDRFFRPEVTALSTEGSNRPEETALTGEVNRVELTGLTGNDDKLLGTDENGDDENRVTGAGEDDDTQVPVTGDEGDETEVPVERELVFVSRMGLYLDDGDGVFEPFGSGGTDTRLAGDSFTQSGASDLANGVVNLADAAVTVRFLDTPGGSGAFTAALDLSGFGANDKIQLDLTELAGPIGFGGPRRTSGSMIPALRLFADAPSTASGAVTQLAPWNVLGQSLEDSDLGTFTSPSGTALIAYKTSSGHLWDRWLDFLESKSLPSSVPSSARLFSRFAASLSASGLLRLTSSKGFDTPDGVLSEQSGQWSFATGIAGVGLQGALSLINPPHQSLSNIQVLIQENDAWIDRNWDGQVSPNDILVSDWVNDASGGGDASEGVVNLANMRVALRYLDVPADPVNLAGFGSNDRILLDVTALRDDLDSALVNRLFQGADTTLYAESKSLAILTATRVVTDLDGNGWDGVTTDDGTLFVEAAAFARSPASAPSGSYTNAYASARRTSSVLRVGTGLSTGTFTGSSVPDPTATNTFILGTSFGSFPGSTSASRPYILLVNPPAVITVLYQGEGEGFAGWVDLNENGRVDEEDVQVSTLSGGSDASQGQLDLGNMVVTLRLLDLPPDGNPIDIAGFNRDDRVELDAAALADNAPGIGTVFDDARTSDGVVTELASDQWSGTTFMRFSSGSAQYLYASVTTSSSSTGAWVQLTNTSSMAQLWLSAGTWTSTDGTSSRRLLFSNASGLNLDQETGNVFWVNPPGGSPPSGPAITILYEGGQGWIDLNENNQVDSSGGGDASAYYNSGSSDASSGAYDFANMSVTLRFFDLPASPVNINGFGSDDRIQIDISRVFDGSAGISNRMRDLFSGAQTSGPNETITGLASGGGDLSYPAASRYRASSTYGATTTFVVTGFGMSFSTIFTGPFSSIPNTNTFPFTSFANINGTIRGRLSARSETGSGLHDVTLSAVYGPFFPSQGIYGGQSGSTRVSETLARASTGGVTVTNIVDYVDFVNPPNIS